VILTRCGGLCWRWLGLLLLASVIDARLAAVA
jgi:hypothetical protein